MLITQLFIGTMAILLTVTFHGYALDTIIGSLKKIKKPLHELTHFHWKAPVIIFTVLSVFFAHIVEIWIWGVLYLVLDVDNINTVEEALYFSTSSFTTVGFGDLHLNEKWRLLSSIEAANGFIVFGWSTAFIFEILNQLYKKMDKI